MIRTLHEWPAPPYTPARSIWSQAGKRRDLGTFDSRAAAEKHEREVQHSPLAGELNR